MNNRQRIAEIGKNVIAHLLNAKNDINIESVHYDKDKEIISIFANSEEFPEVPLGEVIPRVALNPVPPKTAKIIDVIRSIIPFDGSVELDHFNEDQSSDETMQTFTIMTERKNFEQVTKLFPDIFSKVADIEGLEDYKFSLDVGSPTLTLSAYQMQAKETAIYDREDSVIYPALGLCSEAGEVAGKIKKIMRDTEGKISDEARDALKSELGDVLWYLAILAGDLGFDLDEVAKANLEKLDDRMKRDQIGGSGDDR